MGGDYLPHPLWQRATLTSRSRVHPAASLPTETVPSDIALAVPRPEPSLSATAGEIPASRSSPYVCDARYIAVRPGSHVDWTYIPRTDCLACCTLLRSASLDARAPAPRECASDSPIQTVSPLLPPANTPLNEERTRAHSRVGVSCPGESWYVLPRPHPARVTYR